MTVKIQIEFESVSDMNDALEDMRFDAIHRTRAEDEVRELGQKVSELKDILASKQKELEHAMSDLAWTKNNQPARYVSVDFVTHMLNAILPGVPRDKVTAIKYVRELTGIGLKDAKDLVESLDCYRRAPDLDIPAQPRQPVEGPFLPSSGAV